MVEINSRGCNLVVVLDLIIILLIWFGFRTIILHTDHLKLIK